VNLGDWAFKYLVLGTRRERLSQSIESSEIACKRLFPERQVLTKDFTQGFSPSVLPINMEFRFVNKNDGSIEHVHIADIIYSPFSNLLNSKLIPYVEEARFFADVDLLANSVNRPTKLVWLSTLGILRHSIQLLRTEQIECIIVAANSEQLVKEIQFLTQEQQEQVTMNLKVESSGDEVKISVVPNETDEWLGPQAIWSSTNQKLLLHSMGRVILDTFDLIDPQISQKWRLQGLLDIHSIRSTMTAQEWKKIYRYIKKQQGTLRFDVVLDKKTLELSRTDVRVYIEVDKAGVKIKAAALDEAKELEFLEPHPFFAVILRTLSRGMGSLFHRLQHMKGWDYPQWTYEWPGGIQKHQGFMAFFWQQFTKNLKVSKEGIVLQGTHQDFVDSFVEKTFANYGEEISDFDKQSRKMENSLLWLVGKLEILLAETSMVQSANRINLVNQYPYVWLELVSQWIDQVLRNLGPDVFRRTRGTEWLAWSSNVSQPTAGFDQWLETSGSDVVWFAEKALTPPFGLKFWFELARSLNASLTYEGLEVNTIAKGRFEGRFELSSGVSQEGSRARGRDWFTLSPQFFLAGQKLNESQINDLGSHGVIKVADTFYLLDDRDLPSVQALEVFWNNLAKKNENKTAKAGAELYFVGTNETLELLRLRSAGVEIRGNEKWNKLCEFYDQLGKNRDASIITDKFMGELKEYQTQCVHWLFDLYRLGLGGILADDMGLGKTVQTLAFLDVLRTHEDGLGECAIIVPATLTHNWMSEIRRFVPHMKADYFTHQSMSESLLKKEESYSERILIVTYGQLIEHRKYFEDKKWHVVVLDEAQNVKNPRSKRATVSRLMDARFKLCLTGTPLENHVGEFYSLMEIAVPGALGDYKVFRSEYLKDNEESYRKVGQLKDKIKPLVLRRSKKEILKDLPPKTESVVVVPFDERQKNIYRDIALSWNKKVSESLRSQGEAKSQLLMLTALLRLRQVCSDPAALPGVEYPSVPPKVALLADSMQDIVAEGDSAIVFTQFLPTLQRIEKVLKARQISVYSISGSTSSIERRNRIEAFQKHDGGAVFLSTLKTGGVGLNLTKATYVFHLEPWWNPAVENQATDRAHRIGQDKKVMVYRYIMDESVETKIQDLKKLKSETFNALFSTDSEDPEEIASRSFLTQEAFEYLVSEQEPR